MHEVHGENTLPLPRLQVEIMCLQGTGTASLNLWDAAKPASSAAPPWQPCHSSRSFQGGGEQSGQRGSPSWGRALAASVHSAPDVKASLTRCSLQRHEAEADGWAAPSPLRPMGGGEEELNQKALRVLNPGSTLEPLGSVLNTSTLAPTLKRF